MFAACRWLHPDHGYPVRLIIPGYIGGRNVKWLSEIRVSADESPNHYHYYENRLLPPHVWDFETAKREGGRPGLIFFPRFYLITTA